MNVFYKWWNKNHPFKSKYLAIRILWFIFVVTFGTLIYIVASFGSACLHFYEEMKEWYSDVKNHYPKLYKKENK